MLKSLTIIFASLLLLAGCGKEQPIAKGGDPTGSIDLGVVELSLNTPKRQSLGKGRNCMLRAISAEHGNLQIKIEIEEKIVGGELPPGAPPGTPADSVITSTSTVPSGVLVVIAVGKMPIRFTPILKDS